MTHNHQLVGLDQEEYWDDIEVRVQTIGDHPFLDVMYISTFQKRYIALKKTCIEKEKKIMSAIFFPSEIELAFYPR